MSSSDIPSVNYEEYPPQLHAGKVGLGPNYRPDSQPTIHEKFTGYKEELKGKILRDEGKVQHGKEIISGEEKRKAREDDQNENPFATADSDDSLDGAKPGNQGATVAERGDKSLKEQIATVAPTGKETNETHDVDSVDE